MLQKVGGKFPLSPKSNRCVKGDAINIEDPFTVDTGFRLWRHLNKLIVPFNISLYNLQLEIKGVSERE